jgi:hypothetical protein
VGQECDAGFEGRKFPAMILSLSILSLSILSLSILSLLSLSPLPLFLYLSLLSLFSLVITWLACKGSLSVSNERFWLVIKMKRKHFFPSVIAIQNEAPTCRQLECKLSE